MREGLKNSSIFCFMVTKNNTPKTKNKNHQRRGQWARKSGEGKEGGDNTPGGGKRDG